MNTQYTNHILVAIQTNLTGDWRISNIYHIVDTHTSDVQFKVQTDTHIHFK